MVMTNNAEFDLNPEASNLVLAQIITIWLSNF